MSPVDVALVDARHPHLSQKSLTYHMYKTILHITCVNQKKIQPVSCPTWTNQLYMNNLTVSPFISIYLGFASHLKHKPWKYVMCFTFLFTGHWDIKFELTPPYNPTDGPVHWCRHQRCDHPAQWRAHRWDTISLLSCEQMPEPKKFRILSITSPFIFIFSNAASSQYLLLAWS